MHWPNQVQTAIYHKTPQKSDDQVRNGTQEVRVWVLSHAAPFSRERRIRSNPGRPQPAQNPAPCLWSPKGGVGQRHSVVALVGALKVAHSYERRRRGWGGGRLKKSEKDPFSWASLRRLEEIQYETPGFGGYLAGFL